LISLNIYNLFPKLFSNTKEWSRILDDIIYMGFNSIYINPIHYPGFSGSIYAVKDYYKYNDILFGQGTAPEVQLKEFLSAASSKGILVFMDLVVNHTAVDSVLMKDHKNWYKMKEDGSLEKPGAWDNGKWVEWGDLATFDLDNTPDKMSLWNYLLEMCRHYLAMGFNGFRCDAAYQVSSEFWSFLIPKVKGEFKDIIFLAETLGCTPVQIQALSSCGFDYFFNSSKWWNFNDDWCLEQYDLSRNIAPTVSFPETHDTPRLMEEFNGNEMQFLRRLYFEALFSKGFMVPSGFEYGFKKKLDAVKTTPADWEKTGKDYRKNIKNILEIKKGFKPFREESPIEVVGHMNMVNIFCFVKEWEGDHVLVVLNKDLEKEQELELKNLEELLKTDSIKDFSPEKRMDGIIKELKIKLKPAELKIFGSEKQFNK
jgi:starch synthase (maltosyl-transferring)